MGTELASELVGSFVGAGLINEITGVLVGIDVVGDNGKLVSDLVGL